MDIVLQFKDYLFSQKHRPSSITVKNYLSDIRRFITWYETKARARFVPTALTPEVIDAYEKEMISKTNGSVPAIRSTKRYISSLRNFSRFLEHSGAIGSNPFEHKKIQQPADIDPWLIRNFANQLVSDKASKVTIKNYIIDIKQFIQWLERVTNAKDELDEKRFIYIDSFAIEQYKARLLKEDHFSPVSINRKLSSLRRYLRFLAQKELLTNQPDVIDLTANTKEELQPQAEVKIVNQDLPLLALKGITQQNEAEVQKPQGYSRFAPLRLLQKSSKIISLGLQAALIAPAVASIEAIKYGVWKRSGKNVFVPVKEILKDAGELTAASAALPVAQKAAEAAILSKSIVSIARGGTLISRFIKEQHAGQPYTIRNISKEFYAPLKISLKEFSWSQRLIHHLKYTRPVWYRTYHQFPIVNHIHLAILILATSIAGFATYYVGYVGKEPSRQVLSAASNAPPRKLSFQGRLLDKTSTPITADTDLRFSLYNSPTASKAALLWQEVQNIKPDTNGNFTATLGKKTTLTQDLFTNNPSLYVGIAVGNDQELEPREQIPTTNLASNSQTLQGLKPITKTDKTANVILALDSSGDLTIGGTASPTFQATGGQFTLSGQSVLLTTTPGSNGNITLAPDGSGIIDLQKPIQNTSNSNNDTGIPGAVAVDDLLAVAANSSSRSALTVRQNSTGDIISGYNDTIAKFRVKSTGDVMLAGDLEVNGNTITTSSTSFGIANTSVINLSIGLNASAVSIGGFTGVTTVNNDLQVHGNTTVNGMFQSNGLLTATGGLTIPTGKNLTVAQLLPGSIPFVGASNELSQDSSAFTWSQPSKALNVTGSICIRSTQGLCAGANAGTIYASNTTVQAADLAENYTSHDPLEPGDVVMPEGLGDNQAIKKTQDGYEEKVIGIISTNPGFTLNSDAKTDQSHPYLYPLALQGRVPLKVSTINGPIKTGDSLTSSPIPGVAMKATRPGQMIAKALADDSDPDAQAVTKIMAFVNVSYTGGNSMMDNQGNLSMARDLSISTTNNLSEQDKQVLGPGLTRVVQFIDNVDKGVLAVKDLSTNTLSVTSDTIIVGGKTLKNYITDVVQTVQQSSTTQAANTVSQNPVSLNLPVESASPSAIQTVPSSSASSSAQFASIYNSIGTSSAQVDDQQPTQQPEQPFDPKLAQNQIMPKIQESEIAASSAAALGIDRLDMHDLAVSHTLSVLGRTTMSDVGITGTVNIGLMNINGLGGGEQGVGNTFASINTSVGPLKFQSDGYNGVDFLNGKITIDTQGNLNVFGDAFFAKNIQVKGTLSANIIAPVPGSDLVVSLGKHDKNSGLQVENTDGNQVVQVNQEGDVAASGSGSFAGINIVRGVQADTSVTESVANGSAGKGVIKAHQKERTIITPFVTKQSLIYVTATSDTGHTNLYVARQIPSDQQTGTKGEFTIQIPTSAKNDISFNWWIVN